MPAMQGNPALWHSGVRLKQDENSVGGACRTDLFTLGVKQRGGVTPLALISSKA